jgi:hypothetical protein
MKPKQERVQDASLGEPTADGILGLRIILALSQLYWPAISKKPADHPFESCADYFSTQLHKFGPWQPSEAVRHT